MRATIALLALLIATAAWMQGCGGESSTATTGENHPAKAPQSERIEAPPPPPV